MTFFYKTREDHVFHLKHIFDGCRKYDIYLNPKKSVFEILEGKLLGHIISKKGISIDLERIEAISQIRLTPQQKMYAIINGYYKFCSKACS